MHVGVFVPKNKILNKCNNYDKAEIYDFAITSPVHQYCGNAIGDFKNVNVNEYNWLMTLTVWHKIWQKMFNIKKTSLVRNWIWLIIRSLRYMILHDVPYVSNIEYQNKVKKISLQVV